MPAGPPLRCVVQHNPQYTTSRMLRFAPSIGATRVRVKLPDTTVQFEKLSGRSRCALMRKPSSLISRSHCGPEGDFSTSRETGPSEHFLRPPRVNSRTKLMSRHWASQKRATSKCHFSKCLILLAGGPGFEPRLTESESAVLPLNYPPTAASGASFARARRARSIAKRRPPRKRFASARSRRVRRRLYNRRLAAERTPAPQTCSTATTPGAALSAPASAALTA